VPVFAYKGVTSGSRATSGVIDAANLTAARSKLRSDGIFPTEIVLGRDRSPFSGLISGFKLPELRRVPDLEIALFSNQLATLLNAGVPLVESLGALTDQVENARLKQVIARLREVVNGGASLADAMSEHSAVFDSLYTSMVRAGESSGALNVVLHRLGDYVENRMKLRNQIVNAMIYPIIMLTVSAMVTGLLMVMVVPTITGLLIDMNAELPLPTVIIIAVSDFMVAWWFWLALSMLGGFLAFNRFINTDRGRVSWDGFKLRMPILSQATRYIAISRFARTLATLLAGGVNIVAALEIARAVAGNTVIAKAVADARDAITQGTSIASPLRASGQFPPMVTHMISVGESSGTLDSMLAKVSDTYDELVETSLTRLTSLLGPVMLLFVAGIVVLIILSTLLPLMNLTSSFGR